MNQNPMVDYDRTTAKKRPFAVVVSIVFLTPQLING